MSRVSSVALLRVLSLGVVAASAAGLFVTGPLGASTASADIVATDSAVTVKWQGGTSDLEKSQPARDSAKGHFEDFKDLTITVSQTAGLTDQAIKIDFSGLAATTDGTDGSSNRVSNAMNFVQFMQCWGDPDSPTFRNTCEWGGYGVTPPSGLGGTVPSESFLRGAKTPGDADVSFMTAQGKVYSGTNTVSPEGEVLWPLGEVFDASSSNEIIAARLGSQGQGTVNFEAQSANRAPQLGCGSSAERLRCYLVAVPRGSHFGGEVGTGLCGQASRDSTFTPYYAGRPNSIQEGSPLNPKCDYWDNRIVIPMDFSPVGANCPAGSAERRTIGSQLVVGAMSSWQPAMCHLTDNVYNFSTNPDNIARGQLLGGRAGLAFTSYSLDDDTLSAMDATKLKQTAVAYAPVAISGVTVAFFFEDSAGRRQTLNLTPRLMAKFLTDSYAFQNPLYSKSDTIYSLPNVVAPDGTVRPPYSFLRDDPDFSRLNPDLVEAKNPSIILPGPAGADAIKQVWLWITADKSASAWLTGVPDEYGMKINPYYLPKGDPEAQVPIVDGKTGLPVLDADGSMTYRAVGLSNIDGSAYHLSTTPRDYFAKADETLAPAQLSSGQRSRFGALQSAPFADTLLTVARDVSRADAKHKTEWNPTQRNQAGELGDWVSAGPQAPGQKFVFGITDTASAAKYGLSSASLCNANTTCVPFTPAVDAVPATGETPGSDARDEVQSTFVAASTEAMGASVSAVAPTKNAAVLQVNPAAVTGSAYPLTTITYASVNLTTTDATARTSYANLVKYAVTDGQTPGTDPGNLPEGYVPLTRDMVAQALVSTQTMIGYVAPDTTANSPSIGVHPAAASPSQPVTAAPLQAAAAAAAVAPQTSVTSLPSASVTTTAAVMTPWPYQGALGVSLIVGLAGAVFAPILMRPRRPTG